VEIIESHLRDHLTTGHPWGVAPSHGHTSGFLAWELSHISYIGRRGAPFDSFLAAPQRPTPLLGPLPCLASVVPQNWVLLLLRSLPPAGRCLWRGIHCQSSHFTSSWRRTARKTACPHLPFSGPVPYSKSFIFSSHLSCPFSISSGALLSLSLPLRTRRPPSCP
jgi:hypothetical protein